MNNAISVSDIDINYRSTFSSSFCTFSNNNVTIGRCLNFYSNSESMTMTYSNIVHNKNPSNSYGVLTINGGFLKMEYCIPQNNENILFCLWFVSHDVSFSYIYHSGIFTSKTYVSLALNNSITEWSTYHFSFFNSQFCSTDNPMKQNTAEETPVNTYEDTPANTQEDTPANTQEDTPANTYEDTPANTHEETQLNNPIETFLDFNTVKNPTRVLIISLSLVSLLFSSVYIYVFFCEYKTITFKFSKFRNIILFDFTNLDLFIYGKHHHFSNLTLKIAFRKIIIILSTLIPCSNFYQQSIL